jgi:DNA-binding LacI/PurR family transcriptional regulator
MLQETGVPVVFMGKPFDVTGCRCVDADNAGGTAVDYLHAKGRRGIAMIAGIRDPNSARHRPPLTTVAQPGRRGRRRPSA